LKHCQWDGKRRQIGEIVKLQNQQDLFMITCEEEREEKGVLEDFLVSA
jgi:hypothetical protein